MAFFFKTKNHADSQRFQHGYDYAAGQLLKHNDLGVIVLKAYVDITSNPNAFDKGIKAAIQDFVALTKVT